jgi:alanine racemase
MDRRPGAPVQVERPALGAQPVQRGAEAILIGAQGQERILCEEVARRLNTINYEVTCGLTARVRREHA